MRLNTKEKRISVAQNMVPDRPSSHPISLANYNPLCYLYCLYCFSTDNFPFILQIRYLNLTATEICKINFPLRNTTFPIPITRNQGTLSIGIRGHWNMETRHINSPASSNNYPKIEIKTFRPARASGSGQQFRHARTKVSKMLTEKTTGN